MGFTNERINFGVLLITFFLIIVTGSVGYLVMLWKGLSSFLFAWILNFMLMITVLFCTQLTKPRLASTYYNSKKWEMEGKIYEWIGVNLFRKLLVWMGWEKLNKKTNPVKKKPSALIHLEYSTRQSEFGHLVIFFIVSSFTIYVAIRFGITKSLWLLSLNVILNIYPIILQRYNRPRIHKLIMQYPQKHVK